MVEKEGQEEYATFPVAISPLTDEQMADIAWEENAARKDISPIEEARAIRTAEKRFGWTQTEIARRWNLSQSAVSNKRRLLQLPAAIQTMILNGDIGERHGRALLPLLELDASVNTMIALIGPNGETQTVKDLEASVRKHINAKSQDLSVVPWEDDWIPSPCATDDFAAGDAACRICEDQINALGPRCLKPECYRVKADAYQITVQGPSKTKGIYDQYENSWELKSPGNWWRCDACRRQASDFDGTKYAGQDWYKAYGYNICPECWSAAQLPVIAVQEVEEQEIASAPVSSAPAPSPSIPAPDRQAKTSTKLAAEIPAPTRSPVKSEPKPKPTPPPPPKPKATLITIRIFPGDVLEDRPVTASIGQDGSGPTAIRSGKYVQLSGLIDQLCEIEFTEEV
jgi:hypothetical protein